MSTMLHHDPDRRCKPLMEWPAADRKLWQAALMPGDLFDDGGSRAGRSEYSNRNAVDGYGRWLNWLERRRLLDPASPPADRITPARVGAYIADLEQYAGNATQTLLNRLQELRAVAVVMDPARDWSWLNRIYARVRVRHRPARPKRPRLVAVDELHQLGIALMARAERQSTACRRAMTYRDGLIVALLAMRQLRLRNLAGLVLDRTLIRRGTQWWIEFPASETKTKDPIELPWPEDLAAALDTYLARHRGVLARLHRGSARPPGAALWISRKGSPMSRNALYDCITMHTRDGLGHPVNPHLFRDCAATNIAIDDPDHIGIVWRLLGHRTPATTEKYYNLAGAVEASRRFQNALLARRHGDDTRNRRT